MVIGGEMMFCPNCGTECNDKDLFCGECGSSLAEYREEEQQNTVLSQKPAELPKKEIKISKMQLLLIGEVIIMAVLFIGIYFSLDKKYSAETTALEYWKAKANGEWNKVYDFYSFPKEEGLNRQLYVNAHMDDKETKYQSIQVEKNLKKEEKDSAYYVISYTTSKNAAKKYAEVSLIKGERKFLFWNEWHVVPENEVAEKCKITVPEKAIVKLNGEKIRGKEKLDRNGMKEIDMGDMFRGTYQLEVSEDGMKTYKDMLEIDSFVGGKRIELIPEEKEKEKLVKQLGDDIESLLNAAIAKKDFNAVKELFSEDAQKRSYIKSAYEGLYRITDQEGTVIHSFDLSNIKMTMSDYYGRRNEMMLEVKMTVKSNCKKFWSEEIQTSEKEERGIITYVKEGKKWKLKNMPITYYDILY